MAEIFKFPERQVLKRKTDDHESAVSAKALALAMERVILGTPENDKAGSSINANLEAIKDVFSEMSLRESSIVGELFLLEGSGIINRKDVLLLFSSFLVLKDVGLESAVIDVIHGTFSKKHIENVPWKHMTGYLEDIFNRCFQWQEI